MVGEYFSYLSEWQMYLSYGVVPGEPIVVVYVQVKNPGLQLVNRVPCRMDKTHTLGG